MANKDILPGIRRGKFLEAFIFTPIKFGAVALFLWFFGHVVNFTLMFTFNVVILPIFNALGAGLGTWDISENYVGMALVSLVGVAYFFGGAAATFSELLEGIELDRPAAWLTKSWRADTFILLLIPAAAFALYYLNLKQYHAEKMHWEYGGLLDSLVGFLILYVAIIAQVAISYAVLCFAFASKSERIDG